MFVVYHRIPTHFSLFIFQMGHTKLHASNSEKQKKYSEKNKEKYLIAQSKRKKEKHNITWQCSRVGNWEKKEERMHMAAIRDKKRRSNQVSEGVGKGYSSHQQEEKLFFLTRWKVTNPK